MDVTIWHNPRCSKSRQTLALLRDRGLDPVVRLYLQDAPVLTELRAVGTALDLPPSDFLRSGEAIFKELGVDPADNEAVLAAMATHPILIERPIVIVGDRAAIGRPPEAVLTLL